MDRFITQIKDGPRTVPENPFPAAVHDAWEAVLWVLDKGGDEKLDFNTDKLATGKCSNHDWIQSATEKMIEGRN